MRIGKEKPARHVPEPAIPDTVPDIMPEPVPTPLPAAPEPVAVP